MFMSSIMLLVTALTSSHLINPTYVNARYGYTMCRPTSMIPMPESDNGDGRMFKDRTGGTITVWGNYVSDPETPAHFLHNYIPNHAMLGYSVYRPTWAAQSGIDGSQTFWQKTYKRGNTFSTVMIQYPTNRQRDYDTIVKTISSCFKPD